jgi:hypothetical protein
LRQATGVARLLVDLERPKKKGTARDDHDDGQRQQKERMTENVDTASHLLRQQVIDDIDADMFVVEQRPWRAQQEYDAKQHPLQLEPGIG